MPRTKNPRSTNTTTNKQVITMPEAVSTPQVRRGPGASVATPIDLDAQIRERAYALYEERGRIPGQENEDWLRAEREVRARYNPAQTA